MSKNEKEKSKFSEILRDLRKSRNISGTEFAKMLGIPQTSYNGYEIGRTEPSFVMLVRIAQLLNVSVDYLLGIDKTTPATISQSTVNGHNINGNSNVVSSAPADAAEVSRLKAEVESLKIKLEYATELIKNLKK